MPRGRRVAKRDVFDVLTEGERALAAGDGERAYELLCRAVDDGVPPEVAPRLAPVLARAARYLGRHGEVVGWVERLVEASEGAPGPAVLAARVAVYRHLDLNRVATLTQEALDVAEAAGDDEAYATVLAHAAFAAYRQGDAGGARKLADRADRFVHATPAARFQATRARLFAATAAGDLEGALAHSRDASKLAEALGRPGDLANELNNVAECHLALGYPEQARNLADEARRHAAAAGHLGVGTFAEVLAAIATAETGDIDDAVLALRRIGEVEANRVLAIDAAAYGAFWLLERGAAGDSEVAAAIATAAEARAAEIGVAHRLTGLWSAAARARARLGRHEEALAALERARQGAGHTEPASLEILALALAEVLPGSDHRRRTALQNARARILRRAEARDNPRAYCTRVRIHRRLLELSGGVPHDLPAD